MIDEVRDDGLHEVLVAAVANEGDKHLKQLAHQALKVHVVSILICLQAMCPGLHAAWSSPCSMPDEQSHVPTSVQLSVSLSRQAQRQSMQKFTACCIAPVPQLCRKTRFDACSKNLLSKVVLH